MKAAAGEEDLTSFDLTACFAQEGRLEAKLRLALHETERDRESESGKPEPDDEEYPLHR
jgi:hypothetical protein